VVNKYDIEYNISKVQLIDPSRLGAMAQIGSTIFYLLFKIYNSKVYHVFLGKVVFITTHPAKLVS
jgi:hypothetical protein